MRTKDNYVWVDYFRIIAALLVVAIHTSPLTSWSMEADFFLTRVAARIAVPFFFMVTGHFVLSDYLLNGKNSLNKQAKILRYIRKVILLYVVSIILYLPVGIYAGHFRNLTFRLAMKMLLFDGTFYHLWYFPACITGVLLVCIFSRLLGGKKTLIAAVILYLTGLSGDSYFGLVQRIPAAYTVYEKVFTIWSYTRNGLFMAPVFLVLGALVGNSRKKSFDRIGFLCSFVLMTVEAFTLRYFELQRHDSMYLMLLPTAAFLYRILLNAPVPDGDDKILQSRLRTMSAVIYIIHPAMIVAVRLVSKISGIAALTDNSFIHYLCVVFFSFTVSVLAAYVSEGRKAYGAGRRLSGPKSVTDRTWIELDVNALRNNVNFFRHMLPEECILMPVIKANAYGHGAAALAKELNLMGVENFCVACVQEGIELRRAGIKGEILILGSTHPTRFDGLRRYHLSQAVVDYSYAEKLKNYGKKLHVHICIDTGMHRLGERCENIEKICGIFRMSNLVVDGVFTHLSADDSSKGQEKIFTDKQAQRFYAVLDELKARGIKCPKIHIQASYGVLNYPELAEDYARVGIALYGVLSTKKDTYGWRKMLCPVMSLKTRVAAVKEIYAGETVGYGFSFIAEHTMKIAVLAIGYADGLPRSLSDGKGAVLIRGKRAPIAGKVCMDQTLVDVSDIPDVKPEDIAVVIGKSGKMEITVCDLAEQAGSITNEILSRMGARPERIMVFS